MAYFALPVSKETESFVLDRVQKFFDVSSPISPTFKAYDGGWVLEEVEHKSLGEGKKGRAFVGFLGWDSVQEHMDFRETETFKEHIPLIRTMGHVGIEMFHVIRGA